jgi:hypothetical protein
MPQLAHGLPRQGSRQPSPVLRYIQRRTRACGGTTVARISFITRVMTENIVTGTEYILIETIGYENAFLYLKIQCFVSPFGPPFFKIYSRARLFHNRIPDPWRGYKLHPSLIFRALSFPLTHRRPQTWIKGDYHELHNFVDHDNYR